MGQTPEALRQELDAKRDDLSRDLEAIGDRVSPNRMVERKQAAVRMRFDDMRDRVMGAKESAAETMHTGADSATSSVSGAVHSVSDTARQRTEGNPLAVGLVAFGAGLIAATLFPATRREEALAERAQPRLEDAATKMAPAAQQVVEELKPAATDAVEELKDEAKEAAQNVTGEAKDKAKETAASARSAASSAKGS